MSTYQDEWWVEVTETRWGDSIVLDENECGGVYTKVKLLRIEKDKNLSYQYHNHRGETWTVIHGDGILVLGDKIFNLTTGTSVNIPTKAWHAVKAGENGLEILEVQAGLKCEEDDIIRKYYDWNEIIRFLGDED